MARGAEVAQLWDDTYKAWQAGADVPDDPLLRAWFGAYTATRPEHRAQPEFFAEPYLGTLTSPVRVVTLGLNPGRPAPELQARGATYPREIAAAGSYREWAAGWPYVGNTTWTRQRGPNPFHTSRFDFLRALFDGLRTHEVTCFELYPWHSENFARYRFRFERAPLQELVWGPLADLGRPPVFAFGQTLLELVRCEASEVLAVLGRDGSGENLGVANRSVVVARLPGGSLAIAESTRNFFNPPKPNDRALMMDAVNRVLHRAGITPPWA